MEVKTKADGNSEIGNSKQPFAILSPSSDTKTRKQLRNYAFHLASVEKNHSTFIVFDIIPGIFYITVSRVETTEISELRLRVRSSRNFNIHVLPTECGLYIYIYLILLGTQILDNKMEINCTIFGKYSKASIIL